MKRRVATGAVVALLIVGMVAGAIWQHPRTPPAYVPLGPGDTYLALGDSLAAGWTVGDPAESYVGRIAAQLRQLNPAIEVRNLSIPGETSASFRRTQLQRATALIAEEHAAGRRVSPITLDIGGNDANAAVRADNAARQRAVERVQENLGVILDTLLHAAQSSGERNADIVVMNYYNPYGGDPTDTASPAYWTIRLNEAIARTAARRGVPVADVAGEFNGGLAYRYTYITTGDLHANADGHRVIASQFWRALGYPGTLSPQP